MEEIISGIGEALSDRIIELRNDSSLNEDERNAKILHLARDVKMESGGRAAEYIDHFLAGTGTEKRFEIRRLMEEDNGVRTRLSSELVRRGLGIKTVREQRQSRLISYDNCITIFQRTYANSDWRLALGTFNINWKVLQISEDLNRMSVSVWGENLYRWHPDDRRVTQFIHKAGAALEKAGKAKSFYMRTGPTTLVLSTLNREILELTSLRQSNPDNSPGLLTKSGLAGDGMKAVDIWAKEEVKSIGRGARELVDKTERTIKKWYNSL